MAKKKSNGKSFVGLIIKNILLAILIIGVLVGITFWGINRYTQHGVVEIVPDLRDYYVEEAEVMLKSKGLYPEVIDSVYSREKDLGIIIEQIPAPNSTMKRNRPVYLIINSKQVRQVQLPDVSDYSSRQAISTITATGIEIESIQYVPSLYKDLVVDVKYKGESIVPGTEIPEGDAVVLIVGNGLGDEEVAVPRLKGLTLEVARKEIMNLYFTLGAVHYDGEATADEFEPYFIYRQEPSAGKKVQSGTRIDIWLTTDTSLLNTTYDNTEDQEEDFF